jgi:hypothetical protein
MQKKSAIETDEDKIELGGILWLNVKVFGLAMGLIMGLIIFIATNWLILKGGEPVGPHLQLLGQYFIGYRVTFWGSVIGFGYGFIVGALCGGLVGWLYNKIALVKAVE